MRNIIPVSDLQRQAAQILADVNESSEPVVITQRGRASGVLMSAKRFAEIEEDLRVLDDLEMVHLVEEGLRAKSDGKTLSMNEVKRRLKYS